jgi:hypothetical protein
MPDPEPLPDAAAFFVKNDYLQIHPKGFMIKPVSVLLTAAVFCCGDSPYFLSSFYFN